jgi:hypothetical protein
MPHDVFISYSNTDGTLANAVVARLEEKGIRCWVAPRDIPAGKNFAESIVNAVAGCEVFILIWSKNSNQSTHVLNEINRAFDEEKIVIPFRIDDVQPTKSMQYYLGRTHWLDAITPPMEKRIDELAAAILAASSKIRDGIERRSPEKFFAKSEKEVVAGKKNLLKWPLALFGIITVTLMIALWSRTSINPGAYRSPISSTPYETVTSMEEIAPPTVETPVLESPIATNASPGISNPSTQQPTQSSANSICWPEPPAISEDGVMIFDDFTDPKYENSTNSNLWDDYSQNKIFQQKGMLLIKDVDGWSNFDSKIYNGVKLVHPIYFEMKIFVDIKELLSRNDKVDLVIGMSTILQLPVEGDYRSWLTMYAISFLPQKYFVPYVRPLVGWNPPSNKINQNENFIETQMRISGDKKWYTLREEIDPKNMQINFFVDGNKVGSFIPDHFQELQQSCFSFVSKAYSNMGDRGIIYIDYIKIGLIR